MNLKFLVLFILLSINPRIIFSSCPIIINDEDAIKKIVRNRVLAHLKETKSFFGETNFRIKDKGVELQKTIIPFQEQEVAVHDNALIFAKVTHQRVSRFKKENAPEGAPGGVIYENKAVNYLLIVDIVDKNQPIQVIELSHYSLGSYKDSINALRDLAIDEALKAGVGEVILEHANIPSIELSKWKIWYGTGYISDIWFEHDEEFINGYIGVLTVLFKMELIFTLRSNPKIKKAVEHTFQFEIDDVAD